MARYDAEWIAMLNSTDRVRATRPKRLLRDAGAGPGATIVDYGSGPGFLTLPAAEVVGPTGRVIGVDTEPRMRQLVLDAARAAGFTNVETIDPDQAGHLPNGVAQVVGAALFLHDFSAPQRDPVVAELARLCAPGGRLLVIEWLAPGGLEGPSTETRFAAADLAALLRRHGFRPGRARRLGDQFFGMIARRA